MNASIVDAIRIVSMFSVLIPLTFYFLKIRTLPKENHLVGLVVVFSALTELIIAIQVQKNHSTALVSNVYFFLIFTVLCRYYYEVVFKYKNRIYMYFGVGAYVIALLLFGVRKGANSFHGETWATAGLVLVVFGIIYNNYQVEKPPLLDKNLYSGLIFNAAIILYFSFNSFLFFIANYIFSEMSPDESRLTWSFHNVNNIIKNFAFAAGLFYTWRRRLNLSDEEAERIQWRHLK